MRIGGEIGLYRPWGFLRVDTGANRPGAIAPTRRTDVPDTYEAVARIQTKVWRLSKAVADLENSIFLLPC